MGYALPEWRHTQEGPALQALTRRLAECPPEFLAEPLSREGEGEVSVPAVVSDLLCDLGGAPLSRNEALEFGFMRGVKESAKARNRLRTVLVTAWLLHDPAFQVGLPVDQSARDFLRGGLVDLADLVEADRLVLDPERREELARLALRGVAMRPAGESVAVAQDRFDTISSPERARVMREARGAEERARKVREELARKARQEAAATWGSE